MKQTKYQTLQEANESNYLDNGEDRDEQKQHILSKLGQHHNIKYNRDYSDDISSVESQDRPRRRRRHRRPSYKLSSILFQEFLDEVNKFDTWSATIAEFVGQGLLNYLLYNTIYVAQVYSNDPLARMTVIAIVCSIFITLLIGVFAPISGCHMNSMVTVTMAVAKIITWPRAVLYIIAQFIGGIVGPAFLYLGLPQAYRTPDKFGANVIPEGQSGANVFFGEIIAAFILTTVIFGHAIDKRGTGKMAYIAIGVCIGTLIFLLGPISTASLNPFRTLGAAFLTGYYDKLWIFLTAPFIGGAGGGLLYLNVFSIQLDDDSSQEKDQNQDQLQANKEQLAEPQKYPAVKPHSQQDKSQLQAYQQPINQNFGQNFGYSIAKGSYPAPNLDIKEWIQGPPKSSDAANIQVIEFFTTSNSTSYTSPYLSFLNDKFRKEQKNVTIIGVSNDGQSTVRKFVEAHSPQYYVGVDKDASTCNSYLKDLNIRALPVSVVVSNRCVIWVGHTVNPALVTIINQDTSREPKEEKIKATNI